MTFIGINIDNRTPEKYGTRSAGEDIVAFPWTAFPTNHAKQLRYWRDRCHRLPTQWDTVRRTLKTRNMTGSGIAKLSATRNLKFNLNQNKTAKTKLFRIKNKAK